MATLLDVCFLFTIYKIPLSKVLSISSKRFSSRI
nr:MAG TPA: hypothetical protein [Caudoviricetes sp.]